MDTQIFREDTDEDLGSSLVDNADTKRYRVIRKIGGGGKCTICVVNDNLLKRKVVRKQLQPELAEDETENTRLLREARIMALFRHPNSLPIYDIGCEDRRVFFTMQFVNSEETLFHGIQATIQGESDQWSLRRQVTMLRDACSAVEYAHSRGVIHRDIKPENILTSRYAETYLVDWGLAKVWNKDGTSRLESFDLDVPSYLQGQLTDVGARQGTPLFMSPEQCEGKSSEISYPTDVYSLGAVLYVILTGYPMLSGRTAKETLQIIQNDAPVPPSVRSPDRNVPPELESLCQESTCKSANDRISMQELCERLDAWLANSNE